MQSPDHYRRPHTGGGSPSQTISHPLSNCTSPELEPSPRSTYSQSPSNSIHADSRRSSQRITNGAHILEQPSKGAEFHEYDPLHKVLPQRAPDEDAQSAVLKLDKMRRQKEKRRKWRTRTGIVGMMGDATARKKDADGE